MQRIIDEVLKAEQNAEKIIQETRKSAADLKSRIENENNLRISNAHEDAQKRVRDAIAGAKEEAAEKYKLAIKQIEEKNVSFMKTNRKNMHTTVNEIVKLIITPEYERE